MGEGLGGRAKFSIFFLLLFTKRSKQEDLPLTTESAERHGEFYFSNRSAILISLQGFTSFRGELNIPSDFI